MTALANAAVARPRRRRQSPAWRLCLAGSLALHLALLLGAPMAPELKPGQPGNAGVKPMQVREVLIAAAPAAPAALAQPLPAAELPAAAPVPPPPEPALPVPEAQPPAADEDIYLPRRQLDQAPQLRTQVNLLWPDNGPPAGHYSEVVSLFIDEAGIVQRVRVDGPGLPPELADLARDAFLHARYAPGQLQGRAVRSWIRLELNFDAGPSAVSRGIRP